MTTVKVKQAVLGLGEDGGIGKPTSLAVKGCPTGSRTAQKPKVCLSIGSKWRIESDELNVIVYKKHKNRFEVDSYHQTLSGALVELVNQSVRDSDLSDLKAVCGMVDQLRADILKLYGGIPDLSIHPGMEITEE